MARDGIPVQICGFIGTTKPKVVWCYASIASFHQARNNIAIEIGPGGHAMHKQHDRGIFRSLVHIMHTQVLPQVIIRCVSKVLQILKIFLRSTDELCHYCAPHCSLLPRQSRCGRGFSYTSRQYHFTEHWCCLKSFAIGISIYNQQLSVTGL